MVFGVNPVSSSVFFMRRVGKTTDIDKSDAITNAPLAAGQGVSSLRAVATVSEIAPGAENTIKALCIAQGTGKQFSNGFGLFAHNMLTGLENTSKGTGFLANCAKAVDFVSRHINPIIVATTATQIALADDKEEALFDKGAGLGLMFAGEKAAKELIGGKGEDIAERIYKLAKTGTSKTNLDEITKDVSKLKGKMKVAGMAVEGLVLVGSSITSWQVGSKLGKAAHDKLKGKQDKEKTVAENKDELKNKKDENEEKLPTLEEKLVADLNKTKAENAQLFASIRAKCSSTEA